MRKWLIRLAVLLISLILGDLLIDPTVQLRVSLYSAQLFGVREIATLPVDFVAAKARWAANPLKHYRLMIHYFRSAYPLVDCAQIIETVNERAIKTLDYGCSANSYLQRFAPLAQTVEDLFAQLEKESTTIHFQQKDNPICPYFMSVDISYASEGYPATTKYSWVDISPWTLGPQTYKAMYGEEIVLSGCFERFDVSKPNMTITVQPLP
jgi:hypothetical protein